MSYQWPTSQHALWKADKFITEFYVHINNFGGDIAEYSHFWSQSFIWYNCKAQKENIELEENLKQTERKESLFLQDALKWIGTQAGDV